MKIVSARLILILFMATSGTSAEKVIKYMDKLDELQPYYAKINTALHKKLPDDEDVQSNLEQVVKLAESLRIKHPILSGGKDLKLAYQRFVSLPDAVKKCDYESYRILAGNFLANDGHALANKLHLYDRTRKVIQHYRHMHANKCLSGYIEDFKRIYADTDKMDQGFMKQVELTFGGLSLEDFGLESKDGADSLITVPYFSFLLPASSEAVKKVLRNLEEHIKTRPESWHSIEPRLDKESNEMRYPRDVPRSVFHRYLFQPCEAYRTSLALTLDPARFDFMALGDTERKTFIDGEDQFRRALTNNVLCYRLTQHKEDMYGVLSKAWSELSVS